MGATHQGAEERVRQLEAELVYLRRAAALGDVAAMLFAELRCVMAPVSVSNELLAKKLDSGTELHTLALHAASASAFAAKLLRETVEYLRRPQPETGPVPVVEVVEQMRGLLERMLGAGRSVVLEHEGDAGTLVARADRLGLERVLLNLVCQSLDSGAEGPVTVKVARVQQRIALKVSHAGRAPTAADAMGLHAVNELARERDWTFSIEEEAGQVTAQVHLPVLP
jgi:C4-dicarboxylate-specific signal transduction histidine kinase